MKQKYTLFLVLTFMAVTISSASDLYETERLDNTVFVTPQRIAAVFDHDDHNEKASLEDDCSVCHHVYEGKKLIPDESSEDSLCSECHGIKANPENTIPLRMAFHKRCKTCHFVSKKGPVLCGECHLITPR